MAYISVYNCRSQTLVELLPIFKLFISYYFLESLKVRDHLEDLGIDGKIILEWILRNRVGGCGLGKSV
jgi:hypothetical protein